MRFRFSSFAWKEVKGSSKYFSSSLLHANQINYTLTVNIKLTSIDFHWKMRWYLFHSQHNNITNMIQLYFDYYWPPLSSLSIARPLSSFSDEVMTPSYQVILMFLIVLLALHSMKEEESRVKSVMIIWRLKVESWVSEREKSSEKEMKQNKRHYWYTDY